MVKLLAVEIQIKSIELVENCFATFEALGRWLR